MPEANTGNEEKKMETIGHRTVSVNGINMHVAEKGEGPVVLFLHGFPELWYTWRHQIIALSGLGYHAVAPDLRGYGDTDAPEPISSYTCLHVVGDLVALMDALAAEQVYLVGHDWGAIIGWYLCLFRPDRVRAFVSLTVPFRPRNPIAKPLHSMRTVFGDDYYICRFQEPGEVEAGIAKVGTKQVLAKILTIREPSPPRFPKGCVFGIEPGCPPVSLPSWLTEEDLSYYVTKYEHKGFTGPLNYYRAMDMNWEVTGAWAGAEMKVAVKYVVGDMDMTYTTPGVKEYVHGGAFNKDVPLLDNVVVLEGVGHFINQERPQEVNSLICDFFNNF